MQLNTIKAAVQGFVHMLLERHVPVTLNPAKSGSYNGDLINLPPPANGDPETIMAYMGLAAHEAGHAQHSDITVWRTEVPKLTKLGHALAGFIEDARMECRQIQRYPGVAHLLNLHHASVINRMDETVRNMPESFAVPAAVYLAAQSHLNPTRSYPQQFVDSAWRVSEAVLGESFRPAVEQMVTKLSANSTEHDGINLAKEIEAFIQSLLANPAPQPGCADEDQAQANSDPQGQGDQSQPQGGDQSQSDTDRSDEDQAQANSDPQGQGDQSQPQGGDQSQSSTDRSDEGQAQANSDPQGQGDQSQPQGGLQSQPECSQPGQDQVESPSTQPASPRTLQGDLSPEDMGELLRMGMQQAGMIADAQDADDGNDPHGSPDGNQTSAEAVAQAIMAMSQHMAGMDADQAVQALIQAIAEAQQNAESTVDEAAPESLVQQQDPAPSEPPPDQQLATSAGGDTEPIRYERGAPMAHLPGEVSRLSQVFNTVLTNQKDRPAQASTSGSRLDMRRLWRLDHGDLRVFMRESPTAGRTSAVEILLDASGSMQETIHEAAKTANTLAHALTRLSGNRTAVTTFPAGQVLKSYGESSFSASSRIAGVYATGCTPLGQALHAARLRIMQQQVSRRMVIVITDGAPDSIEHAQRELHTLCQMGVLVVGIGIGMNVNSLIPTSVEIQDVSELSAAFATLFRRGVGRFLAAA